MSSNPERGSSCSSMYMAAVATASMTSVAATRKVSRARRNRCVRGSPRSTIRTSLISGPSAPPVTERVEQRRDLGSGLQACHRADELERRLHLVQVDVAAGALGYVGVERARSAGPSAFSK